MKTNPVFRWNYETDADVVINQGGTSSSKTFSILQVLFLKAIETAGSIITVAGQDIPNLKRGAIRDAKNIVATTAEIAHHIKSYNGTDKIFNFTNGSIIEFTSYDDWQDAKNGKRDYLFINEANGVPFEIYHELQVRTRKQVFLDYNPNIAFWVHDKLIPYIGDPKSPTKIVRFISNYTHNKFLDSVTIKRIEAMKDDPVLWRVYGLGYTGKVKGLVFPKWEQAFNFPEDCNKISYGLDFGFSESKAALTLCGIYDRCLYAKQLIYETELSNADLIEKMKALNVGRLPVYADSAEPKSIAEIKKAGINIIPINKANDATNFSIRKINEYDAVKVIGLDFYKEVSTYAYKGDKPIKQNDHLIDALRYYVLGIEGRVSNKFTIF
jgi:phage terminase large subunit